MVRTLLNLVRLVLLAAIVWSVYPAGRDFLTDRITQAQAVDAVFTNQNLVLFLGIVVISVLLGVLDSPAGNTLLAVGGILLAYALVTGQLSFGQIEDRVTQYRAANEFEEYARSCGYDVTLERTGDDIRAVLKGQRGSAAEVQGTVGRQLAGKAHELLDDSNEPIEWRCLKRGNQK